MAKESKRSNRKGSFPRHRLGDSSRAFLFRFVFKVSSSKISSNSDVIGASLSVDGISSILRFFEAAAASLPADWFWFGRSPGRRSWWNARLPRWTRDFLIRRWILAILSTGSAAGTKSWCTVTFTSLSGFKELFRRRSISALVWDQRSCDGMTDVTGLKATFFFGTSISGRNPGIGKAYRGQWHFHFSSMTAF